jgi:hypothetical protein
MIDRGELEGPAVAGHRENTVGDEVPHIDERIARGTDR